MVLGRHSGRGAPGFRDLAESCVPATSSSSTTRVIPAPRRGGLRRRGGAARADRQPDERPVGIASRGRHIRSADRSRARRLAQGRNRWTGRGAVPRSVRSKTPGRSRGSGPRAHAASLHQASAETPGPARSRALPDRLRAQARRGRRADRVAPLHSGATRRAKAAGDRGDSRDPAHRARHVRSFAHGADRGPSHARRALRDLDRGGACDPARARARRKGRRGGHHGGSHPRDRSRLRRARPRRLRQVRALHPRGTFSTVDIVTNFHLPLDAPRRGLRPRGERVLAAYEEAVRAGYRFFSW